MNVLLLCHRLPYPPNKGEKIRAFHILQRLVRKHTVHLGTFIDDPADRKHIATVQEIVDGRALIVPLRRLPARMRMLSALLAGTPLTTSYFSSAKLRRWVHERLSKDSIDRVILFSTAMVPLLDSNNSFPRSHVILDMVDIDSDKWRQYAKAAIGPRRWILQREARTLFNLERQAAGRFFATLLVSAFEARGFAALAPEVGDRIYSVPNGVDLSYFSPGLTWPSPYPERVKPIVMTGTMDYWPNAEGVLWFADKVLPTIVSTHPTAHFYVVGSRPHWRIRNLFSPNITVTGAVDDVRPYLAHADAVVAPLRLARGVQNKVLEAFAMEKPVVASGPATRALAVTNGLELLIADEPDAFAEHLLAILAGQVPIDIAAHGRRYVQKNHNWEQCLSVLDDLLNCSPIVPANPHTPGSLQARNTSVPTVVTR
jgi:sugar transferase (PEP-CTERM/EpsH1 system associated)